MLMKGPAGKLPWTLQAFETAEKDDHEDKPAQIAVCAFVANNLHRAGNQGS